MYKNVNYRKSSIVVNNSTDGEYLEQVLERKMENKEAIGSEAPLIYTEKSEGVGAGYNIRTDRFEIALDGIDKIQKSRQARRDEKAKMQVVKDDETNNNLDGKAETNQG